MRSRDPLLAGALLVVAACAACTPPKRPDMTRMSGIASLRAPQHPLILIHGFLGSKLREPGSERVIWGTVGNVLTGGERNELALHLEAAPDPAVDLQAFQLFDGLWGVDVYRSVLESLEAAGGYRIGDIHHPLPGDNAFVFLYDWRRDNVESAQALAAAIEHLTASLGQPDLRFDLLCHSQGGLIARYYVNYGAADLPPDGVPPRPTMAGADHVNKVILLGTPNQGALEAMKILHEGVRKVVRPIRPEAVFTMPAVYQMLPPKGSRPFVDADGQPTELDLYDPGTWVEQGWSVFSPEVQGRLRKVLVGGDAGTARLDAYNLRLREFLERSLRRAQHFHDALEARTTGGAQVDYYAFGADCISTLKAAVVLRERGKPETLFNDERFRGTGSAARFHALLYGPGDGTVLMQSLLALQDASPAGAAPALPGEFRFKSAFFVCQNHGLLASSAVLQNNLFYVLLWPGDLPSPPRTALTLR